MAGKYGSASVVITYDASAGGSPQTITPYVTSISEIGVEQINEKSTVFGIAYDTNTPVGVQMLPDITIEGFYDTTATSGPHVVFSDPDDGPQDSTRTFTFAPGDSKTFTVETRLASYKVIATVGQLSKYRAVLKQAGAGAWT